MNEFFRILARDDHPWAYTMNVLAHGGAASLSGGEYRRGDLCLMGPPFFNAVNSVPGSLYFVSEVVEAVVEAGLVGVSFTKVALAKVVRKDWSGWDLNAEGPPELPPGSPETYIIKGVHDQQLADSLPDYWRVGADRTYKAEKRSRPTEDPNRLRGLSKEDVLLLEMSDVTYELSEGPGSDDVFKISCRGDEPFFSSRAKELLEPILSPWLAWTKHPAF